MNALILARAEFLVVSVETRRRASGVHAPRLIQSERRRQAPFLHTIEHVLQHLVGQRTPLLSFAGVWRHNQTVVCVRHNLHWAH